MPPYAPERSPGRVLAAEGRLPPERVALVDILDRLLAGGVVIAGDIVLSIADIDLVRISLRALLGSVRGTEPFDAPFDPLGQPYAERGREADHLRAERREGDDDGYGW
ncbi:gas vesicle protein [Microbispora cellulosiformans]|uniref:Gas vesicle protein n=1 Tax=Microbispora cellulosiformans TaxID=2614688 RepID=A0A5J5JVG3_9ACTN|nr:gas vesicle protein [Microbispora cellulosiformans]